MFQVSYPYLTFSDGLPFSGNFFFFYPKPLHFTRKEKKKFHPLIFQRCQTSRILMKLFQYDDLLELLKLKPMGTP